MNNTVFDCGVAQWLHSDTLLMTGRSEVRTRSWIPDSLGKKRSKNDQQTKPQVATKVLLTDDLRSKKNEKM